MPNFLKPSGKTTPFFFEINLALQQKKTDENKLSSYYWQLNDATGKFEDTIALDVLLTLADETLEKAEKFDDINRAISLYYLVVIKAFYTKKSALEKQIMALKKLLDCFTKAQSITKIIDNDAILNTINAHIIINQTTIDLLQNSSAPISKKGEMEQLKISKLTYILGCLDICIKQPDFDLKRVLQYLADGYETALNLPSYTEFSINLQRSLIIFSYYVLIYNNKSEKSDHFIEKFISLMKSTDSLEHLQRLLEIKKIIGADGNHLLKAPESMRQSFQLPIGWQISDLPDAIATFIKENTTNEDFFRNYQRLLSEQIYSVIEQCLIKNVKAEALKDLFQHDYACNFMFLAPGDPVLKAYVTILAKIKDHALYMEFILQNAAIYKKGIFSSSHSLASDFRFLRAKIVSEYTLPSKNHKNGFKKNIILANLWQELDQFPYKEASYLNLAEYYLQNPAAAPNGLAKALVGWLLEWLIDDKNLISIKHTSVNGSQKHFDYLLENCLNENQDSEREQPSIYEKWLFELGSRQNNNLVLQKSRYTIAKVYSKRYEIILNKKADANNVAADLMLLKAKYWSILAKNPQDYATYYKLAEIYYKNNSDLTIFLYKGLMDMSGIENQANKKLKCMALQRLAGLYFNKKNLNEYHIKLAFNYLTKVDKLLENYIGEDSYVLKKNLQQFALTSLYELLFQFFNACGVAVKDYIEQYAKNASRAVLFKAYNTFIISDEKLNIILNFLISIYKESYFGLKKINYEKIIYDQLIRLEGNLEKFKKYTLVAMESTDNIEIPKLENAIFFKNFLNKEPLFNFLIVVVKENKGIINDEFFILAQKMLEIYVKETLQATTSDTLKIKCAHINQLYSYLADDEIGFLWQQYGNVTSGIDLSNDLIQNWKILCQLYLNYTEDSLARVGRTIFKEYIDQSMPYIKIAAMIYQWLDDCSLENKILHQKLIIMVLQAAQTRTPFKWDAEALHFDKEYSLSETEKNSLQIDNLCISYMLIINTSNDENKINDAKKNLQKYVNQAHPMAFLQYAKQALNQRDTMTVKELGEIIKLLQKTVLLAGCEIMSEQQQRNIKKARHLLFEYYHYLAASSDVDKNNLLIFDQEAIKILALFAEDKTDNILQQKTLQLIQYSVKNLLDQKHCNLQNLPAFLELKRFIRFYMPEHDNIHANSHRLNYDQSLPEIKNTLFSPGQEIVKLRYYINLIKNPTFNFYPKYEDIEFIMRQVENKNFNASQKLSWQVLLRDLLFRIEKWEKYNYYFGKLNAPQRFFEKMLKLCNMESKEHTIDNLCLQYYLFLLKKNSLPLEDADLSDLIDIAFKKNDTTAVKARQLITGYFTDKEWSGNRTHRDHYQQLSTDWHKIDTLQFNRDKFLEFFNAPYLKQGKANRVECTKNLDIFLMVFKEYCYLLKFSRRGFNLNTKKDKQKNLLEKESKLYQLLSDFDNQYPDLNRLIRYCKEKLESEKNINSDDCCEIIKELDKFINHTYLPNRTENYYRQEANMQLQA